MLLKRISNEKWIMGPWNSNSPLEIGFIKKGKNETKKPPHFHQKVFEFYIITHGKAKIKIKNKIFELKKGDVLMVEPSELHGLTEKSLDFECIIIKYPSIPDDKFTKEK